MADTSDDNPTEDFDRRVAPDARAHRSGVAPGSRDGWMLVRRALLEVLPGAALLGAAGLVLRVEWLAGLVLVPLALGLGAGVGDARAHVRGAREDGTDVLLAAVRGGLTPLVSIGRTYARLRLWRSRGVYDAAAISALLVGWTWWLLHAAGVPDTGAARWFSSAFLLFAAWGVWLRRTSLPHTPERWPS
ncbi:MAG: hypothetical protein FJ104_09495 [Deltaproteobacteria bacterium]|nr:hypothetical protein [Deltaproteobacteria bacterium]